ncbi:MAG: SLC13/DASS family transporter [Bacteroidaceae bacterium]|nr:SLC13/DASS family transporter [Bacteroidaceae bacterium]
MLYTLIVLAVTALLFALNRVRSDVVALCALIALLVAGILSPAEALSGFSNPVVIMMAGLFIVGGGIVQTGLAKMVSSRLMTLAGQSELRLFLLVMLVTGFTGAFISNTGTVALMLPIVVSMAHAAGVSPRRLLMPLAFASSLGIMTLISTPPNLVIDETLREAGYPALGFFSFLPVGLICLAVGIVVLLPLTRWLLQDKGTDSGDTTRRGKSLSQLVREYGIAESVSRAVVGRTSQVIGRSIAELDIRQRYGLTVLEVRRERSRIPSFVSVSDKFRDISQTVATPDVRLQEGDIIYLSGSEEQAARFAKDGGLTLSFEGSSLDFYDIGMAEIVLLRQSKFVGRRLSESGFRSKYSINVLGIRRGSEYILEGLADVKMLAGIYFTTSLLTMFISNTATAVLMAPIALASAQSAGISPVPLLFAVAVSASMCFASPFSTPPNALVMKAGRYTFMDYVRVGLPLQLIMGVVMVLVLPLLFPFA